MFEFASPVIQCFGSHHAYSWYATPYFGMSSLGQGGNSDVITKTTICSACAIPQQCGTVLMFQLNCSGIFCRGHGVDGSSEPSSSSGRSAVWTAPWHGDVRSESEPRDPKTVFRSTRSTAMADSKCTMSFTTAWYRSVQGGDSDMIAKNASTWDRLKTAVILTNSSE